MIKAAIAQPITPAIRSPFGQVVANLAPPPVPVDPLQARLEERFGAGQVGIMAIIQPTVLGQTALYKDAAMTDPVLSAGDPVGAIRDFSPWGYHLRAPTSSARGVYRTDGELHWIEFNGVNTQYETVPIAVDVNRVTVCAAVRKPSNLRSPLVCLDGDLAVAPNYAMYFPRTSSITGASFATHSSGTNYAVADSSNISAPASAVLTGRNVNTDTARLWYNGVLAADGTDAGNFSNFGTRKIVVGRDRTDFSSAELFGLYVGYEQVDDLAPLESYFAERVGVSL
jgi:hypothetical protein